MKVFDFFAQHLGLVPGASDWEKACLKPLFME